MNDAEYREWMRAHMAAFPGILDWLKRQGTDGSTDVSNAWKACLSDVDRIDALEATKLMNLGEESVPTGFGDHARAVRKLAKRLRSARMENKKADRRTSYVDGEPTVDCRLCQDSGWVMVVNIWRNGGSRPLAEFWSEKTRRLPECAIECTCRRSDRFNAETMFVIDHSESVEDRANRFEQWWSEGRHLGKRVAAFDRHNQGL